MISTIRVDNSTPQEVMFLAHLKMKGILIVQVDPIYR